MNKYTLVTVAHQVDYEALCLQARSMAKYLSEDLIAEIIVVNNGITGNIGHLRRQYGRLGKLFRLLPATEIAPAETFKAGGWWTQQVLKLMIAKHVRTPRYVCLDAKNTMVFPLQRSFLETRCGKPKSYQVSYETHSSRRWLHHTLDYYGLADKHIYQFGPIITPYTMITRYVKDIIGYIEKREKRSFAEVLLEKQLTEFFLYWGYLVHIGVMPYRLTQPECKVIFDSTSEWKYVKQWVDRTEKDELPFFSVHRGAKPSEGSKRCIQGLWTRRGIS